MSPDQKTSSLVLSKSLKGYFFENLREINLKSSCPLPESLIFYSSDVLDRFSLTESFYDLSSGKVREKILGIKLLEAQAFSKEEQVKTYKEIGEMSLLLCGYFSDSVNHKIVDRQYYSQLGKMAFSHLNHSIPSFLDIPAFYQMLCTRFEALTTLMSIMASHNKGEHHHHLIFTKMLENQNIKEEEIILSGMTLPQTKKVS